MMQGFAALLDRLSYTPGRLGKLRLLTDYFARTPDPARGYALAALAGNLNLDAAKPSVIRDLVATRVDAQLFEWSYDYVGDLAETAALIWPERPGANCPPDLPDVVERLQSAAKGQVPLLLAGWIPSMRPAAGRC